MGLSSSKHKTSPKVEEKHDEQDTYVKIECKNLTEKSEVDRLKKEYSNNLQTFLFNQVLFSVMFFKNYEKELEELILHDSNKRIEELRLTKDIVLTSLKPDDVFSLVNQHVYFSFCHGPRKNKAQPLVTNRIYVIYENIQVVTDTENDYANIDKPWLTAQVLENTRPGYVKLRYIEDMKFKSSVSSDSSFCTPSDASSLDDDRSESYGRITQAREIRWLPLDEDKLSKTLFPITKVKLRNLEADEDDEEKLYKYEYYVDSTNMKEKFQNDWTKIAKLLDLDVNDAAKAGFNCDSIFCFSSAKKTLWEIIPAVQLPNGAYGRFVELKRRAIEETKIRNLHKYTFPTKLMLKDIKNMDRLAVPRGFLPKHKSAPNKEHNLQWEIAHPKVERNIQNNITHTPLRVLLMMVLIHKTYIEPRTNTQGVTLRHLVIHFFAELQKDVMISEVRMGSRLIEIIKSFCKRLGVSELPDYFEPERNHFENIPSPNLHRAQQIFSRTKDSPLIHFMSAIRNLKYFEDIYPKLDVKELYRILTTKEVLGNRAQQSTEIRRETKKDWETRRRTVLRQEKEKRNKLVENENLNQRKVSVDSISPNTVDNNNYTSFNIDKINLDEKQWPVRSRQILSFFLDHYLKMAASCNDLGNEKQSKAYMKQANFLVYLFPEMYTSQAYHYQNKIAELSESLQESRARELCDVQMRRLSSSNINGPDLPERGASTSTLTSTSTHIPTLRIINKNHVDMSKVQHQHQTGDRKASSLFRKRHESERSGHSDHSDKTSDKTSKSSEDRKRVRSVNFASEAIVGIEQPKKTIVKEPAKKSIVRCVSFQDEDDDDDVDERHNIQVRNNKRESEKFDIDFDDYAQDDDTDSMSNLDFDGLDEIWSDDDDDYTVDVVNPLDSVKVSKLKFDQEFADSFS